jgi:hypothetical protein
LDENSADIISKNFPEKLHTKHTARIRNGNLECWREDVEDKRLLLADRSITSTAMTAQSSQPTVMVRNSMEQEGQFRKIYAGLFVMEQQFLHIKPNMQD